VAEGNWEEMVPVRAGSIAAGSLSRWSAVASGKVKAS